MEKINQIKENLNNVLDPTSKISFKESQAIKHVGIDEENNTVMLVIEVAEKNPEVVKEVTREIAKIIKIDMGFTGVKIDFVEQKKEKSGPKTILIASGKGGVGKSTVTANLAYALMRLNKNVAIIDADVYGANMPKILGGMDHQLVGNKDGKIYPFVKDKIQMVSTEYLVEKNQALLLRGPMLNKVLKLFFEDTLWNGEIDYFLVDLPPGTGDIMLDMRTFIKDPKLLLITTPQSNASHIAIKAGYASKKLGQELIGVIENMSYYEIDNKKHFIFGQGGGQEVADELNVELLGQIPIVPSESSIYSESENAGIIYLGLANKIMKLV